MAGSVDLALVRVPTTQRVGEGQAPRAALLIRSGMTLHITSCLGSISKMVIS
jgi:hypothetical protein